MVKYERIRVREFVMDPKQWMIGFNWYPEGWNVFFLCWRYGVWTRCEAKIMIEPPEGFEAKGDGLFVKDGLRIKFPK